MTSWPVLSPRSRTVTTADGVPLLVQEHGPRDAPGTVLLVHGYELDQRLWARQVASLTAAGLRVVTYDHRGHGRSGPAPAGTATITQLGLDLREVLDTVPPGPVVLVGHSMGGMSVMALAEQQPSYLGDRVVAVALVSTSAGGLADVTYGLVPAFRRVARLVTPRFNSYATRRVESGRGRPRQPGMRWLLFGERPDRDDVRRTVAVLQDCPPATCEAFYWAFPEHDRLAALARLAEVPVLVACGDRDRLTPLEHSRAIAAALPHAQLVVHPGCGHMLPLERADDLGRRLQQLALSALPTAARRAG